MQAFTVKFQKEGFGANAAQLPAGLTLTPVQWSSSDRGGPKYADIVASGSAESLASLAGWLGDRVQIYSGEALLWHGILWDIEINLDRMVVQYSLDTIYNRVKVIYPHINADGSEESRTTDWAEDATSVDRYGARELLYGKPAQFTNAAETVRDRLLAIHKDARASISTGAESRFEARLSAKGLWEKAASVYFTNPDGLIEHRDESGSVYVGMHIISDLISFGTSTPGGEADEMWLGDGDDGDFLPLEPGDTITITGSASNDDTYTISHMDDDYQIGISGSFTPEAAGADVKVSLGDGESQTNLAIEFEPATSWTCTHVAVKCRKVGSPSDNFRIGIYPDVSGSPGTVLSAVETLGSALYTELAWTEFTLPTPVDLTASTKYWLGIRRTGSANLDDGYEVALDENLGYADGVLRVYDGSAWVARDPDADMPFRIIGEISSTAQIAKCIDAVDDFRHTLVQVDSEVPVRQYVEDERTVMEELNEMLDAGVSSGERLIAYVANDDSVVVTTAPASSFGTPNLVLGADGKLRYATGGEYPPGMLIFGRYVEVDSILLLDGLGIKAGRGVYVAESTYDATTGTLSVSDEGALDPFQSLVTRRG